MKKFFIQLWRTLFRRLKGRFVCHIRPIRQPEATHDLHKPKQPKAPTDKLITPARIEKIITKHWDLRFNEMDNNIELRPAGKPTADFVPMNERSHNSLVMQVQNELPQCCRSWVDCYLFSEAVASYHPLRHYLKTLPAWDGHDRVAEVCNMISSDPLWHCVFHRWMRAMVAGWQHEGTGLCTFQNHLAPLLVSEQQGLGKSTFCRSLLPPPLQCYYTDKFDLTADSHAERRLGCMALINMDEFDRYNERQMGTLKNMMQLTQVSMRRPHGRNTIIVPRMASFIGTSNFDDLLTDPSGSRRFYCQSVKHYIGPVKVDHDLLYAQLVAEIEQGEPILFSKDEEAEIERHNRLFYRESPLEDEFNKIYRLPKDDEKPETVWLSAGDIFDRLKCNAPKTLQGITVHRMGKLLRRMGARKVHTMYGNRYAVMERETPPTV